MGKRGRREGTETGGGERDWGGGRERGGERREWRSVVENVSLVLEYHCTCECNLPL